MKSVVVNSIFRKISRKMKPHKRTVLATVCVACALAFIPIIGAFADSGGDSVSSSDVSASDAVSSSDTASSSAVSSSDAELAAVLSSVPMLTTTEDEDETTTDVTVGDFTVTGGTLDTDYSYANGTLTILTGTELTISTTQQSSENIVVSSGVSANIILAGVNIKTTGYSQWSSCPLYMGDAGASTITLAAGTTNTLDGSGTSDYGPGICAPSGSRLEITGSGTLTAKGGESWPGIGRNGGANILISGGDVTAIGGSNAAGIGGSWGIENGNCKITIAGGTVTAVGGSGGAGIGGGCWGSSTSVTISGGYIDVTAGDGANAIGGGDSGSDGTITITGGYFTSSSVITNASGYTVYDNVESTKSSYPYVVLGTDQKFTVKWVSEGTTLNTVENVAYSSILGQSYDGVSPTKDSDAGYHYTFSDWSDVVVDSENSTATYTATFTATGHSYEAVVTEPTCTEDGYTTYTCSVCGDSYTADETEATGHSYGDPTFTWADDGSSCTATFTCTSGDDIQTVDATVESVATDATCTKDGATVYTATVTFNDTEYTDTLEIAIPAVGHSYTSELTKEPTYTEEGERTYTCTACGDSYTEAIDVLEQEKVDVAIIDDGTDKAYTLGSGGTASVHCTGELSKFLNAYLDGVLVDSSNYTLAEGSTILTFTNEYLETLTVGDHEVTLIYTNGSATTTLTVLAASTGDDSSSVSPGTGDDFNAALFAALMLISGAAIAIGAVYFVRKRKARA